MNELIDHFCESRRRPLIVTAVTVLIALLTVLPLTDQYSTLCNENDELGGQLSEINRVSADLPRFETRVAEKQAELESIEQQTVPERGVSDFRNKLISFVRDAGCRVNRISVGTARSRQWHEEDNPNETSPARGSEKKVTPFALETRPVTLSIAGSHNSVKKLLAALQADSTMWHTKFFEIYPTGKRRTSVQLDLELWCYALARDGG